MGNMIGVQIVMVDIEELREWDKCCTKSTGLCAEG
jgi:hypothetical protein